MLEGKPGFRIGYAENVSQAQIPQVARGYADDGASLIIGQPYAQAKSSMPITGAAGAAP